MKSYYVCKLPTDRFSAVVIATGTSAPQEALDQVAADLCRMGVRGQVVFDLLAANGTRSRRFFAIPFDGRCFPQKRFTRVEADESVHAASARFFCEHADEVDLSLVAPSLRGALSRGLAV